MRDSGGAGRAQSCTCKRAALPSSRRFDARLRRAVLDPCSPDSSGSDLLGRRTRICRAASPSDWGGSGRSGAGAGAAAAARAVTAVLVLWPDS